ncbi:TonB-dependent receptor plug domain-containing protein [Hyphococcus lacteus]|uniref:TonB-dependent receptor n=1 Tax=Hyphococcus lacteus TaxID=3143536 RepID=A0ABV3ZBI2_9PROT
MLRLVPAMMGGVSLLAIGAQATAQEAGASSNDDTIVVTGSRIVRDGYSAPTPVTVVTTEELTRTAPGGIADGLNQLPQFAMDASTQNTGNQATNNGAGNFLNLRGLGSVRNLILLDGQRIPPTTFNGTVDVNIIPSALVERVEVVTGGASAQYGSDAVSGVINYILDKDYNGLKGQVQGGLSGYGDDKSFKASIAGGFDVLGDRGHVLFSYDHYERDGLPRNEMRPRGGEWWGRVGNGTEAAPYRNQINVLYQTGTFGTLFPYAENFAVNDGNPLEGMHFLPNGQLVPFDPGISPPGTSNKGIGGDGSPSIGHTLTGSQLTDQFFGRFDFEVGSNVNAFAQLSFTESRNKYVTIGSGTQTNAIYVYADNAYLPPAAAAALAGYVGRDGIAGTEDDARVGAGRIHADQPFKEVDALSNAYTFLTGLEGTVGDFNWKATYAYGDTILRSSHAGNFYQQRFFASFDAVRDPDGNIVCNITLTNPGLMDDCRPINWFGEGSPSQADMDWVSGFSKFNVKQNMHIVAGEFSGDAFDLPAGPVSFAVGGEYRKQKLNQTSNSNPAIETSTEGLRTNVASRINKYNSTNVGIASGAYSVREAFIEAAVPILSGHQFAENLDFNGAFRYTDYSTSGGVKTWKLGMSWTPFSDLRFRYTRSRDIRAPTLFELYAGDQAARGGFFDPLSGRNDNIITLSGGNPNLTPEIGNTHTAGVVWQPSSIPGLSASVDYFNIKITDAISRLNRTAVNDECIVSGGTSTLCQYVVRPYPFDYSPASDNFPVSVRALSINQALLAVSGLDYELSYNFGMQPFGRDANIGLRLLGSYVPNRTTQADANSAPRDVHNKENDPTHRINLSATYQDGPFGFTARARFIGSIDRTQDVGVIYEEPTVAAIVYTDITVDYDFEIGGGMYNAYLTINNVMDTKPPLIANGQPGQQYPTNQGMYDVVGRYFTAGLKFEF